jgi:hypothetical protein
MWSNGTARFACNGAVTAPSLQFRMEKVHVGYPRLHAHAAVRLPRVVQVTLAVGVVALVAAACGGGGTSPGVAALKSKGAETTTTGSTGPGSPISQGQLLAYAACMRKSGVPNFPDPPASGPIKLPLDLSSPAFEAAQAKCQKLMPGGGPPGPGSTAHPSAQALKQMLKVSQCMRRRGISEFPDPGSSVPSNMAGIRVVTDMHGVILAFPFTLDMWSAAFAQAEAACNFGMPLPERGPGQPARASPHSFELAPP